MPMDLARLEKVDLRTAWPNEAMDFTPWLAKPENLRVLGETVGLELDCAECENAVGPFSADIICTDTYSDARVLVENQIERTDHDHLGKLLTYAAGLKASTIIWVAKHFREEHRAAIDWLNEITSDEYSFFGLEVELWKISDSPPAPKFNIVCKPNDWSRDVRQHAREDGELSDGRRLKREYWAAYIEHLRQSGYTTTRTAQAKNWMDFPLGRTGIHLSAIASTWNNDSQSYDTGELRMQLYIKTAAADKVFAELGNHRHVIEQRLAPDEVHWSSKPEVKARIIYVRRDANVRDRIDWPEQHEWLRQRLLTFEQVFRPLVAKLESS